MPKPKNQTKTKNPPSNRGGGKSLPKSAKAKSMAAGADKSLANSPVTSPVPPASGTGTDENDETYIKGIIAQVQNGEDHLFKEVIDRYRSQVAGIAYKMVQDYDDAKDITQMVFVKTFKNIKRFDSSKRFSTWLYRIAVNASIDYIRKFKKHKFEELDDVTEPKDQRLSTMTPEQTYELKEVREFILKSASRLNEKQHTAFVLKDLEGRDIDEIAQIMNMPQATVRWYLHRARKHLRADLKRHFGPILNKLGISNV